MKSLVTMTGIDNNFKFSRFVFTCFTFVCVSTILILLDCVFTAFVIFEIPRDFKDAVGFSSPKRLLAISYYIVIIITSVCFGYNRRTYLPRIACYTSILFIVAPVVFDIPQTSRGGLYIILFLPYIHFYNLELASSSETNLYVGFFLNVTLPLVAWLSAAYGEYLRQRKQAKSE